MAMTTTPSSGEPEAHGSDGRQGRSPRTRWTPTACVGSGARLGWPLGVVAAAVALTAAAVALAQGIGTFRDVPANHYAGDAVQWAVQNNITFGCLDGTYFCPETDSEQSPVGDVPLPLPEQRDQASGESGPSAGERVRPNDKTRTPGSGTSRHPRRCRRGTFTTRGTQHHTRSFSLPAGLYEAVFTLEAQQGSGGPRSGNRHVVGAEPVILIQVEYRENSSSAWKTHAVNDPEAGYDSWHPAGRRRRCSREAPAAPGTEDVEIANVPGRLPTSGQTQGQRLHGRRHHDHPIPARGRPRQRATTGPPGMTSLGASS